MWKKIDRWDVIIIWSIEKIIFKLIWRGGAGVTDLGWKEFISATIQELWISQNVRIFPGQGVVQVHSWLAKNLCFQPNHRTRFFPQWRTYPGLFENYMLKRFRTFSTPVSHTMAGRHWRLPISTNPGRRAIARRPGWLTFSKNCLDRWTLREKQMSGSLWSANRVVSVVVGCLYHQESPNIRFSCVSSRWHSVVCLTEFHRELIGIRI